MRVLVCGGRDYTDRGFLYTVLDNIHTSTPISCVIEGGAMGADSLAKLWAINNQVSVETYEAQWKQYGRAAGPIRNRQMLNEGKPDIVIAFAGGKGTRNMVKQAKERFVPVRTVYETIQP